MAQGSESQAFGSVLSPDEITDGPKSCDAGLRRRFTLGDMMIVTAAVSVALALMMPSLEILPGRIRAFFAVAPIDQWIGRTEWRQNASRIELLKIFARAVLLTDLPVYLIVGLIVSTPTVLFMRLRRPRPSWRALACQPGAVACAAGTLGLAVFLEMVAILRADPPLFVVGMVVAAAWVVQAVRGRWRAEKSWIDRAGRIVGVGWIVTVPLIVLFLMR